jgi:thioredoxin-related protein
MIRVVLVGGALMVISSVMTQNTASGDCLPCGPELLVAQPYESTSQTDPMYVVGVYDPARNPAGDLVTAIARAMSENKRILIQVGGNWCVWCHILDEYIKGEKEIRTALDRSFLILKVNYDTANRNETFLSKYPTIHGYPHIFVLEKDGLLLHSQHTDEFEEGRSYSRSAILGFLQKWTPTT